MAYAAVISLHQTIQCLGLLDSANRISISSSSHKKLKNAQKLVNSLKQVIKSIDGSSTLELNEEFLFADLDSKIKRLDDTHGRSSDTLTALDGQIRDAAHKFEDILDFHLSEKFLSLYKRRRHNRTSPSLLSLDLDTDQVWQGIKSFATTARKLEEAFVAELDNLINSEEDDNADQIVPSYIDFGVEMVGFSSNFTEIKEQILRKIRPTDFAVFSILGVAGTGRTAAARASFDYLLKSAAGEDDGSESEQYLDCGAWVTVGKNYNLKEIKEAIFSQINESNSEDEDAEESDLDLYGNLEGRRYMIVLDDVCDSHVWEELRSSLPEEDNGSLVLLTTGLREVALSVNTLHIFEMTVFDERESWAILEQGIFGEKSCPPELEEAGKKIAKNCEGRRIALAKAVIFLLKAEREVDCWNKLAADQGNQIFKVADELSEICIIENDNLQLPRSIADNQRSVVTDMVALSGFKEAIEEELFPSTCFPKMDIIYILGMAGIGKTKLTKKVLEDPDIFGRFDNYVWLTLGPKYKSDKVIQDILAQVSPEIDTLDFETYPVLEKRWLIVLDDVWDTGVFYHLSESFPDIRGKVLVTTRQETLIYDYRGMPNQLNLLSKEESWSLFCHKVFDKLPCPPELEKAGKKIVENCEELPLLILTVAESLSKSEKVGTPEFWNILAKDKENPFFLDAFDEISKVLYPSYEYLPQYLRACFLYMGAFSRSYEIPTSKLINLLSVEAFLEPKQNQTVEKLALHCVHKLSDQNLIMFCEEGSGANAKTYSLHTSFWHLSNSLAAKSKFLRVLDGRDDADSVDCKNNQRRICIRNVIALIDKDVYDSLTCMEAARSLLCFGPNNRYPVPINLGLKLLRVLDALTIRFYEFPNEVVELFHLRYLALTCDGNLPSFISKLWFLQILIVHRYQNVRSSRNNLSLPVEIWDMKELKHLQVAGSNLLDPDNDARLPNLLTLLDVGVQSCTEKILSRMPNLKKLGIRIELAPHDASEKTFHCLNFKSVLRKLKSLKYVVVNPQFSSDVMCPFIPIPMFSSSLKKLKLSGFGYPWEYMSIIGKLQNLKVLKLQYYAFRGPQWDTDNGGFTKLEFLSIEDCDVERWNVKRSSFPELRNVIIKHCYKLKELPFHLSNSMVLIEVIDCNPLVVKWARQMEDKETKNVIGSRTIGIEAHSSWEKLQ